MSNSWLRLWHDMPTDPKFRTIAKISKQPLSAVIAMYTFMLVDASNATERGRTQANDEDIASALDLEIEQIQAIKNAMQGRVLEGNYLTGWEKRQPKREDNSAERSKAWRDSKKRQEEEERKRTQTNANDPKIKIQIREDNKKKPTTNVVVKKEKFKLPENFCVTEKHRELAKKNGWPPPDEEFDAFRDHHIAKANKFADWDRTFYTWLRNSAGRFSQKPKNSKIDHELQDEIKKIFSEILPVNPINQFSKQAEQDLQSRINEDAKRKKLGFWKNFFLFVKCSVNIKQHEWHLDYLVRDQTFANILNGKRHTDEEIARYKQIIKKAGQVSEEVN